MPLLVASQYEEANVLGITFHQTGTTRTDRAVAVFYHEIPRHSKIRNDPGRQAREYLFTTVHELGHLLGLPHAWDPLGDPPVSGRDLSALTFMSYPDQYRLGYRRFYRNFRYQFRPEELAHLRHAAWRDVWPGSASTTPSPDLHRRADPRLALELRLPGQNVLREGDPVQLEVKLWNRTGRRVRMPRDVLELEGGRLSTVITGPDDAQRLFRPLVRKEFRSGSCWLGPETGNQRDLPHALYTAVDLTYDCAGFPFRRPGAYRIEARAQLSEADEVVSAPVEIEVQPATEARRSIVETWFEPDVGRALVLGLDPHSKARAALEEIARHADPAPAAAAALRLGQALSARFKQVRAGTVDVEEAEPSEAAEWLDRADDQDRRSPARVFPNPMRTALLRLRARCLNESGQRTRAEQAAASVRTFVERAVATNPRLRRRLLEDVDRWRRSVLEPGGTR